jgi:G3E family GTPase
MEMPIYLFTGFLEAGKTSFIQQTLTEQTFTEDGNTLLLVCEEGIEEFDPSAFMSKNVYCEVIEDEEDITPELLASLAEKHKAILTI